MSNVITVWLVEDEYNDYRATGVFSSKENAKMYAKAYGGDVVERILDPEIQNLKHGLKRWDVWMMKDGTDVRAYVSTVNDELGVELVWPHVKDAWRNKGLRVVCLAKDEEHAITIANEKRTQMIADGRWPDNADNEKVKA